MPINVGAFPGVGAHIARNGNSADEPNRALDAGERNLTSLRQFQRREQPTCEPSAGYDLTIQYCRSGRHLPQQLRNERIAVRKVVPVAADQDDTRAYLVGLDAIAVKLHLSARSPASQVRLCRGNTPG
jgi:hypothetical protein